MANQLRSENRIGECGFSLVEVAVSLAIVTFTCITLLGALPIGLLSFHQAVGVTVESQIVESLSNDILLANFSNANQYSNQTFYYDNEGAPLANSTGAIYTATVSISGVGSSNSPAALTSTSAYIVNITITNASSPTQSHVYSVIIANNNL
jgi:uncharacterized protein (TIGR02598 family)